MTKKAIQLIIIPLMFLSCSDRMKFDIKKWNDESDRGYFHYRNAMLDDLLENYHLKGKTIKELQSIFGYVDYDSTINQQNISFEVYQEWKGIDPSYTKYLVLRLSKNKTVDSVYFNEFKR